MKQTSVINTKAPTLKERIIERNLLSDNELETDDIILESSSSFEQKLQIKSIVPKLPINNTKHLYIPIQLPCGIVVQCRLAIISNHQHHLSILNSDLQQCLSVLPTNTHALLKRTTIWINQSYEHGSIHNPKQVKHMTTHHASAWLERHLDNIQKTHGIEIYSFQEYIHQRQYWNGYGLILHELCHIIHQFVLTLENQHVKLAHKYAAACGKFKNVYRRDWKSKDMAYALTNEKEFFTELSVAYLCHDFLQLDEYTPDNASFQQCSPPFLNEMYTPKSIILCCASDAAAYVNDDCVLTKHCNKFYPFTKGQLKYYDCKSYQVFERLWEKDIKNWVDTFQPEESFNDDSKFCHFSNTVCL